MARPGKTLAAIFAKPTRRNIDWKDIESLFAAYGAEITEGAGSRVRVSLNDVRAVFHRPHPRKEAGRKTVDDVRDFLISAGVKP